MLYSTETMLADFDLPGIFRTKPADRHQKSQSGFTMVELLTVMAVISVLAVLSVPTLGLFGSRSLTAGGNQIADMATVARQNSISNNSYTAIVIKTQGACAYTAYCLVQFSWQYSGFKQDGVTPNDGSSGQWQAVTPWRYLPKGIIFSPTYPSTPTPPAYFLLSSTSSSCTPLPSPLPVQYPFQGQPIDLTQGETSSVTVAQVYKPDGTLATGQTLILRLLEGTCDTSGNIVYTHPVPGSQPVQPANYYDIVFIRDTGQTKIQRL